MSHVFLVAFEMEGDDRAEAEFTLHKTLIPTTESQGGPVVSWHVAENDRRDGSSDMSAEFVPYEPVVSQ